MGLMGREGSVAALRSALAGPVPAVVLYGEAGVGKTALMREVLVEHPHRMGGALATLSWMPFLALRRALAERTDPFGSDEDRWSGDVQHVAEQVERALGSDLLVVDDVHWADRGTVEVVELLAGRVPVLTAIRQGDEHAEATLDRLTAAGFEVHEVEPLDDHAARLLARAIAPDLSVIGSEVLVERSGGNPLLLEELARAEGEVPDGLEAALRARLRTRSEEAIEGLALLALAGHGLPAGAVPGVAELETAGLVSRVGEVADMRHAIVGEVVAGLLSEERRMRCHRRLAAVVSHPGDVARHLLAAGDVDGAHDAALAAVSFARTPGERATHLATAARSRPGPIGVGLHLQAVEAALSVGDGDLAAELLSEVPDDASDPGSAAAIAYARARCSRELRDDAGWRTAVTDGLVVAEPGSREETLLRLQEAHQQVLLTADVAQRAEALAQAEAMLRRCRQQGWPTAPALYTVGTTAYFVPVEWSSVDPAARLREAMEVARVEGDLWSELRSANNLLTVLENADPTRGLAVVDTMVARTGELRLITWQRNYQGHGINLALLAGDYARVLTEGPALLAEHIRPLTRDIVAMALGVAQADAGRTVDALRTAERHLSTRPEQQGLVRVFAHAMGGRPEAVLAEVVEQSAGWHPSTRVQVAPHAAWAAHDLDVPAPPPPEEWTAGGVLSAVAPELEGIELLRESDHAGAATRFAEAADRSSAAYKGAELRCRWAQGEALRRSGQDDEARDVLLAVEAECAERGMLPQLGRVHQSLRAMGIRRSAPVERSRVGELTVREQEVLGLVRDGLTDRAIGARLGISHRTVESLVTSGRRKLGATNRRQAAALLEEAVA